MKNIVILLLLIACSVSYSEKINEKQKKQIPKMSFIFKGKKYILRSSEKGLHEFTPEGQNDLSKWLDMFSINILTKVNNGDALALAANNVLTGYKANKAMILKTDSTPRKGTKPAEHFIAALFPRPGFIEAVLANFKLVNGKGVIAIYCHRIYGKKAGNKMSTWLISSGKATEPHLRHWVMSSALQRKLL